MSFALLAPSNIREDRLAGASASAHLGNPRRGGVGSGLLPPHRGRGEAVESPGLWYPRIENACHDCYSFDYKHLTRVLSR